MSATSLQRTVRTLACALLAMLASCKSMQGEVRDGRYFDPSGSWSVATPGGTSGGFDPLAGDGRGGAVSSFFAGSLLGPTWCVVVDARPRKPGSDLEQVADALCLAAVQVLSTSSDRPFELVHASRRELAGAPAVLRVYSSADRQPKGRDEPDLFQLARPASAVHAVLAVERGPALVTFRMSVPHQWLDRRRIRPSQRMLLEGDWEDLLAWVPTFRWEPAEPGAQGSSEQPGGRSWPATPARSP